MKPTRFAFAALFMVSFSAALPAQGPSGTVRGRVTDVATQQPLAGVSVTVGSHVTQTQSDGRYFVTGVAPGDWVLRARIIGYAPLTQPVTVAAGQTVSADLQLTAQAVNLSELVVVG